MQSVSALVGSAEVAQLLGVSRQRVNQLVAAYEDFPEPVADLAAGRIWAAEAVEAWMARHPDRRSGRAAEEGGIEDSVLDDASRQVFRLAEKSVIELGHTWMGCEHLLIGLLEVPSPAADALTHAGLAMDNLVSTITNTVGQRPRFAKPEARWTPRITAAMAITVDLAARDECLVTPSHILRGIIDHKGNVGCMILTARGINLLALRAELESSTTSSAPADSLRAALQRIEERLDRIEAHVDGRLSDKST